MDLKLINAAKKLFGAALLLFLILSSGCTNEKLTEFVESEKSDEDNDILMSGVVALIGDYTYYRNFQDEGQLYRSKAGESQGTKIDIKYKIIDIMGDWIYYTSSFPDTSGLYKMKTDGTEKELLISGNISSLSVYEDFIYYTLKTINHEDIEEEDLYKIKIYGGKSTKIANGIKNVKVREGLVYCASYEYKPGLYKITLEGEGRKMLSGDSINSIFIYKTCIYYTSILENSSLYRINLDGSGRTKIADIPDNSNILNVDEEWIYFDDGRKGLFKLGRDGKDKTLIGYTWTVPVSNWTAWDINPSEVGKVSEKEGGFVPLSKALDDTLYMELPGFRIASSYGSTLKLEIKDIMSVKEIADFKDKFMDSFFIYPSGLYQEGRAIEARIAVGVTNTDELYLESIMKYFSDCINISSQIIIFTVLDNNKLIQIDSIGYKNQRGLFIQKFDRNYYNGYDISFSKELADKLELWDKDNTDFSQDFIDGMTDRGHSVYLMGNYSDNVNSQDILKSSPNMYTGEIAIYMPDNVNRNSQKSIIENIIRETEIKYGSSWINVVLFYCEPGSGGMINRKTLCSANKFPGDSDISIIFSPN